MKLKAASGWGMLTALTQSHGGAVMSLIKKLSLAALLVTLGVGVTACNKKEPTTEEPTAAEKMGRETGEAKQNVEEGWDKTKDATSNAADAAADKANQAAGKAEAAAEDAKQSTTDAKEDFKKGYNSTQP